MENEQVKCLIIGSGPAGYTAAIYAARANLSPVLYEGIVPGGQLTSTTVVENFPGYPEGISGFEMMEQFKKQARRFGSDVRFGVVTHVDFSKLPYLVTIDGRHVIEAETVILATGATAKYLGIPSEQAYLGMGVSACATCDGFFHRGQQVAVVGGGDTACESAAYLSTICKQVYMIVRKNHLRASKAMQHRVLNTPNIEVLFEHVTREVIGDPGGVTGVLLDHKDGERMIDVTGFFVAIGHHPNTELFKDYITLDKEGYIVTEPGSSKTNLEGIFAAGDVRDPNYQQAVTAAGSGCMAAIDCERYLLSRI